ncbi:GntR family transcriptional regulator [Streptomyces paludis]|uniref:GntR family transcriptional regulator n=1 Tax=Streptomyces paludis TaxID=2282738 RepID=A0A345I1F6_9ACTN|nr:GntR family transcriptional regulator [Streptomyces paludis]AXG82780.1 GntR family transcriptional regulator [Streptomyces paludis]
MSQKVSPRGTFLKIADAVKSQIEANPEMTELPSVANLMSAHGISRGVALRAFGALREAGIAEPVAGGRWRVLRGSDDADRRPLADRIAEIFVTDELKVGVPFPSASALSERFGVARPTVAKVLNKFEAAGLLSESRQGKPRTVRALPDREERPEP